MNDPSPFSLQDEIALITGCGSGLGLAIARCFVQAGARVILVGRRQEVLAKAAADLGDAASFIVHDVNKVASALARVDRAGMD